MSRACSAVGIYMRSHMPTELPLTRMSTSGATLYSSLISFHVRGSVS